MRVRGGLAAAAAAGVAFVGSAVVGSPAMAGAESAAERVDDWVVVDGDIVMERDNLAELEAHRQASDRSTAAAEAAAADNGYALFDPLSQNVGSYTIRLRNTPGIEAYRPLLEDVASRLRVITGGRYAVAPGLTTGTTESFGEILVEVNALTPCGSDPSIIGCGGPRGTWRPDGYTIWQSGRVWLNPGFAGAPIDQRQELIDHEIGHALGLDHRVAPYLGELQVMYPVMPAVGYTYRAGDQNGLNHLDPHVPSTSTPGEPARFVPLAPRRLLDTRIGVGRPGTMRVPAGSSFDLQVTGGTVPPDASAVVLTVAATSSAGGGHITIYPAGTPRPTASSLNLERVGQTIANQAIVRVGQGGRVTFYAATATHLVADITGYFVTDDGSSVDGRYVALTPTRLLDTRPMRIDAGATVDVQILERGGVPSSGVSAVVLSVAVVQPVSGGHVTIWPEGSPPVASSINADHANQIIAGHVTVAVGGDGKVRLRPAMSTHLVIDVQGYYTGPGAPAGAGGLFVPLNPRRVLDTRWFGAPTPARQYMRVSMAGADTFASGTASGVVFNMTATGSAGPGHVQALPWPPAAVSVSNLNLE
jgi:hypothetical protein